MNELNNNKGLEVVLRNTKLDDECFVSNVGLFTSFCSKVRLLDISENNITAKTIQVIKNCLESVTTMVQCLKLNYCPISDLTRLCNLIKEARKLTIF